MPSFIVKKELLWDGVRYYRGDVIEIAEGNPRLEGLAIAGFITYNAGATAKEAPERAGTPREQTQAALILPVEAVKPSPVSKPTQKRRSRKKSKSRVKRPKE